jgi:hypothetical protein
MNKNNNVWRFPFRETLIDVPINFHPGAFGYRRNKHYHTGVDLYTYKGCPVYPCEGGIVVKIDVFTGPKRNTDHWNETLAVMVEGESGVINYAEIIPESYLKVGLFVGPLTPIGKVTPVLKPEKLRSDIPNHSTSMLHLEWYNSGTRDFSDWVLDTPRPDNLFDPTVRLIESLMYETKSTNLNSFSATWFN